MMLRIPALLSPDEVRQCRQALEQAPWQDGRATAGPLAAQVKANLQLPLDSQAGQAIGNLILDKLGASALFMSATLPLKVLPPRFNRYEGGGTYGNHIDNAIFTIPGTAIKVRSDVSTTVFFSEPDEYEGGELIISDTYGEHEVKLPAGDLIVYPSSSLHQVRPVTRGARVASFFWVQSMIRDDVQRRLLWEMDGSIERLRQTGGDAEAVLQLTGVYHNLLRRWSEV